MAENNNVNPSAPQEPKAKAKSEKITLVLIGAGSCTIEDVTLQKGEHVELETAKAERFLNTGLFMKA